MQATITFIYSYGLVMILTLALCRIVIQSRCGKNQYTNSLGKLLYLLVVLFGLSVSHILFL